MRKRLPVIILLAVQLIFIFSLAAYNPVRDMLIRIKGTEYIFEVTDLQYYGNFKDDMLLYCNIKTEFDGYYEFITINGKYGIINTNENGLSYLSEVTNDKPQADNYIKSENDEIFYFTDPHQKIDYDIFVLGETTEPPLFIREKLITSDEYRITASVYVYNGNILLNKIFVNGTEIEEFLISSKER